MALTIKRLFRSYNGRHFLSRWARKLFERTSIQKYIGYYLISSFTIVFFLEPAIGAVSASQQIGNIGIPIAPEETKPIIATETTLAWPVGHPRITQGYHFGHWGIDIQDKQSKRIYPVDKGWVLNISKLNWGYGNHIRIQHPNGRSSLYAHLDTIYVKKGQEVNRNTVLGLMGRTGWATGVHLHLEIYQDGKHINPLSVLPENKNLIWYAYKPDVDVFHISSNSAISISKRHKK